MLFLYQLLYISLLLITAGVGDYLLEHCKHRVFKAFADNCAHSLIGLLAWLLVSCNLKYQIGLYKLADSFLCMIIASFIDLDHFFAAKSIHLRDAVELQHRPLLHLSTIPLVLTVVLLGWAHWSHSVYFERLALINFVAFSTHHTRDAHRRGYWFAPIGTTPPLSIWVYLLVTILIPYSVVLWWKCCRVSRSFGASDKPTYSDMELL